MKKQTVCKNFAFLYKKHKGLIFLGVRIDATRAAALLSLKDDILLFTHMRPDGDTCGSASALCIALRKLNKRVYIQKNSDANRIYVDIIAPFYPPDNFCPKYFVAIDIAAENMFTFEALDYISKCDLCIDHHKSNSLYANNILLDPKAAAAGELILDVIDELGVSLDKDMADMLYTSVSTDTGCFKFSNTTAKTLRVAARCYEAGANAAAINKVFFDTVSRGRMRLEKYIYDTISFYDNDRLTFVALPLDAMKKLNITNEDMDNISAFVAKMEGAELSLILTEKADGSCRLSARSSGRVDASNFCFNFGGGGHLCAAGASIKNCNIEDSSKMVVDYALEFMKNV